MSERKPEAGCGAAIRDAEGRILLIQRMREPEAGAWGLGPGAWGLPGGKIDFGEPAIPLACCLDILAEKKQASEPDHYCHCAPPSCWQPALSGA